MPLSPPQKKELHQQTQPATCHSHSNSHTHNKPTPLRTTPALPKQVELEGLTDAEIGARAVEVLGKLFPKAVKLDRLVLKRWSVDPFARGTYSYDHVEGDPGSFYLLGTPSPSSSGGERGAGGTAGGREVDGGAATAAAAAAVGRLAGEGHPRVAWCGEHTYLSAPGTAHGAYEPGRRAAAQVLAANAARAAGWAGGRGGGFRGKGCGRGGGFRGLGFGGGAAAAARHPFEGAPPGASGSASGSRLKSHLCSGLPS